MKRRDEYLVLIAGLVVVAAIAYWMWPRPTDVFVVYPSRGGGIPVMEWVESPRYKADFHAQPVVSKNRLVSGEFESVYDVRLLPKALQEFYGIGNDSPLSGMANPGGLFNSTDVVVHNLPSLRLVFAAVRRSDDYWMIYFQHGGRSPGYGVDFLSIKQDSVAPLWRCYLYPPAEDLQTLRGKVRSGACK